MRKLNLEECKELELNILSTVADFCDKHGLRYYLTYGTLIGAVRHKGFIPWDDDVDINMPRDDYNKFLHLFNEEMKNSNYFVIDPRTKRSRHSFAKVIDTRTIKKEPGLCYHEGEELGIDIDIFPLDGMPSDDNEYQIWYKKLYHIYYVYANKITDIRSRHTVFGKIKMLAMKLLSGAMFKTKESLLKKAEILHSAYPYENSEYVGSIESAYQWKGNRVKKENFDGFVMVPFEGYSFKAPQGYHQILTSIYGDYMKLPPIDKQVTHHSNEIFWIGD